MSKKTKHYVNNKDFYQALLDYEKLCKAAEKKKQAPPSIPNYIGVCIEMICQKLSMKGNFIRYTFRDEMIEDGVLHCIAAVGNYNTKYSNPFAYFTSIAWHAFVKRIELESQQNYINHKNLENLMVLSDEFYTELGGGQQSVSGGKATSDTSDGLQRHYEVIRKFEEKMARKKEKTRQASLQKKK